MRRLSALVSILMETICTPIATAALLPVPEHVTRETANQRTSISALPFDPIPNPPSMQLSVLSDPIALQLPSTNYSVLENSTASIHFHIPDTPIDLGFTHLGRPLSFRAVFETVDLALDEISTNVGLHPTESITDGFFEKHHEGLAIRIYQYVGKQVTWALLSQLLLGIQYYVSQLKRSCELRFEIDISESGRVGYGSLWYIGLKGKNVAKRDVNETSQQLRIVSVSEPVLNDSDRSLLSPGPKDNNIIFSYHFYGSYLPESAVAACFRLARQTIRTNVQLHPHDGLSGGFFQHPAYHSPVSIGVEAYARKEISWLFLDDILRELSADLIGEHHLWACEFEFEIYPYAEPHGHGYLQYSPAANELSRRGQ